MEDHQNAEQITVPVIEEELVTGTRAVKTGSVRVRKRVEHIRKEIDMPTVQDVVSVSRVTVNRVVATMPNTREEGDTLIVPVVEEEIVVHKRLVLKEEIHIRRRRVARRITKAVTLDREHATVERLDAAGNPISGSKR
jgi:uncharacterized protein (TIGR02271 family)